MPVEKETTIESFDRFKTVDSYKQNVGSLTDANMAMVPVPVQHLELTKADTNLANLTAEGKALAAGLGVPDLDRELPITVPTDVGTVTYFTAPEDGFVMSGGNSASAECYMYFNFKYKGRTYAFNALNFVSTNKDIRDGFYQFMLKGSELAMYRGGKEGNIIHDLFSTFYPLRGVKDAKVSV